MWISSCVRALVFMTLLSIGIPSAGAQSSCDDAWKPVSGGFTYQGGLLSCQVRPDGHFSVAHGQVVLFNDGSLFGNYVRAADNKLDSRFFLGEEKPAMSVRQDGDNQQTLRMKGLLKNKKYPSGAAKYTVMLAFSPDKVDIRNEVELMAELASHSHFFADLCYMPAAIGIDRGMAVTMPDGSIKMVVWPATYTKEQNIHLLNAKQVKMATAAGLLTMTSGEKSGINISDARSYDQKNPQFRFDLIQVVPWNQNAVSFPAGTPFAWNVTFELAPPAE